MPDSLISRVFSIWLWIRGLRVWYWSGSSFRSMRSLR